MTGRPTHLLGEAHQQANRLLNDLESMAGEPEMRSSTSDVSAAGREAIDGATEAARRTAAALHEAIRDEETSKQGET